MQVPHPAIILSGIIINVGNCCNLRTATVYIYLLDDLTQLNVVSKKFI